MPEKKPHAAQHDTATNGQRSKPMYNKTQPTMVSVVEEQSHDENLLHILPLGPSNQRAASNPGMSAAVDSNGATKPNLETKLEKEDTKTPSKPDDTPLPKALPTLPEELKNPILKLDKKPTDLLSLNNVSNSIANINDMKLKKATNPSISNLRAMSVQQNYPTVSSASTTLTKDSTRAEYFAAKLHDAIKNDTKNQNDVAETFVYDTMSTTTPPIDHTLENTDNSKKIEKDLEKNRLHNDLMMSDYVSHSNNDDQSHHKEKLQNIFVQAESPTSHRTLDENFDLKSRSSLGSRKHSRKKGSKASHNFIDQHDLQPLSKVDNDDKSSVNQLRQITSRLFDNRGVQPRRYSAIDNDYGNEESFEDDLAYYESNMANMAADPENFTYISNNGTSNSRKQRNASNTNNPFDFIVHQNDLEYDDELSEYFPSDCVPGNNSHSYNNHSFGSHNSGYLNKQQIHGNMLNIPDYGSIHGDKKRPWQRNSYYSSPHDFTSTRALRLKQLKSFCYSLSVIVALLFIGFISGFIIATNKELQNLKVLDVDNVLVSQEELVFDMVFSAFNPGLMPVTINSVQFDIFAKTQYIFVESSGTGYETVLLGTVETLDVPLFFQGGFLNRKKDTSETQIRILDPCSYDDDDDDEDDGGDNDSKNRTDMLDGVKFEENSFADNSNVEGIHGSDTRWMNISRHPFDLIVRGALIYKLPFSSQNHTISISYTSYVDPGYEIIG